MKFYWIWQKNWKLQLPIFPQSKTVNGLFQKVGQRKSYNSILWMNLQKNSYCRLQWNS